MNLRRAGVALVVGLLTLTTLQLVHPEPAAARKVANPGGGYSLRVQSGFLRIKTNSFDFVDEGRDPQCSDGANNDEGQDTAIDFPADPQCTSALDDSEVQPGFQAKQPIQMNSGTIDAAGNVAFPSSGVSFPTQYVYVPAASSSGGIISDFIATINIIPLANFTGTINPITGAMTLRMQVRVSITGGPLSSGCQISPIDINVLTTGTTNPPGPNTPISGIPYNAGTGRATIVNNSFSVPGASNCGTVAFFYNLNDAINDQFGLPSPAGNNEGRFLVEFMPTRPQPGATASFTTAPSSGPAPLTVNFNASASTGIGLSYQWDFTNNGSFDATGVASSTTYNSPGSFTARLRVTDSDGDFAETTRLVTVGANQPPIANSQSVSTPEDTPVPITLTGTDPEGFPVTYALNPPSAANGMVTGTPPNVIYTPNLNYNGPDSFGFRVTDNFGNVGTGVVSVTVTPVNDPPVAVNVSAGTAEDTPVNVTLVATDVDGDALTYSVVTPPTKGQLTGTGPTRTYTPNTNEHGVDSFTFRATDPGGAQSNVATATITIAPVNDPPVATPQSVSTAEDTPVAITLTGTDVDGDPLAFSLVSVPAQGALSGALPNLTYTPAANYHGADSFVFRVTDPSGASSTATVSITVSPVNDAPVAFNASVGTLEDTPVTVNVIASDVDGDSLTYTPTSPTGAGGTVTCTANACTYTPPAEFSGVDTFDVLVEDGNGGTAVATITVNVSALNNTPPVMNDATVIVIEDIPRLFGLTATDADGDPLSYEILVPPSQGSLSCSAAGGCTYIPAPNATAAQTFVVQASDGKGGIDDAVITLLIVPANDLPVVTPATLVTAEDTTGTADLVATDPDGDTLTWVIKRAAFHGAVSCTSAGSCTYTPNANYNGPDSFEVEVDDGHGGRVRATVQVTVQAVNDAPVAAVVSVTVPEDGSTNFSLAGSDADGDVLSFAASPATLGTLTCSPAGACSFAAGANLNGTDTIAYTVSDGTDTTTGAVAVTIVPVNDPPIAATFGLTTDEDTPVGVTLAASDPDAGDTLTFAVTGAPSQGFLSGVAPALTYYPAPNASGAVTIAYQVTDLAGASSSGTVTITVLPVDDPPVANSVSVVTPEDTPVAVPITGSDVEGPVTVQITAGPSHGTYNAGVYSPAQDYNGPDAIHFTVTDGGGQTAPGVASIEVTPVNDPPVAHGQSVSTTRTVPVPVTLQASDVDGDPLVFAVLTGPGKGTLSGSPPNLTYTPAGVYEGPDSFTFKVTDGGGATSSSTVNITVLPGGNLPTQMVAAPATVTKPSGVLGALQPYTYNNLKGTLTTTGGVPVPNRQVVFRVNGTQICVAATNGSGVATCSGTGPRVNATTYTATFGGATGFSGSSATGTLS